MAKGYLIITDISGYTQFLTKSELEHAHEILQTLFQAQLNQIEPPFVISSFRGDAIVMYVPESAFLKPQSVLEALENLYCAFFSALEQMQFRTTCTCRACREMSTLDLKMVSHYGDYLVQQIGDQEELLGADVIVPHRMLKNHVIEQTGVESYALFTEAAKQALDLPNLVEALEDHVESYEHFGELKMVVYDLSPVWEKKKSEQKHVVACEDAWVTYETIVAAPPALVWDYINTLDIKAELMGLDYSKRIDELGGRFRNRAKFHCVHGDFLYESKIVDWDPFNHFTVQATDNATGLRYYETCYFIPHEMGTKFISCVSTPEGDISAEAQAVLQGIWDQAFGGLKAYVEEDIARGKVSVTPETELRQVSSASDFKTVG